MYHPVQTTPIKIGVYLLGIVEKACACEIDLQTAGQSHIEDNQMPNWL